MLDGISRPIDAWPLAVPESEYSIDFGVRHEGQLLSTGQRGERKIFVYARGSVEKRVGYAVT